VRHGAHPVPENERQARPLTKLDPELQKSAWQQVLEEAGDEKVTASLVSRVVSELLPPKNQEHPPEDDGSKSSHEPRFSSSEAGIGCANNSIRFRGANLTS
jgi:hypothetical protein